MKWELYLGVQRQVLAHQPAAHSSSEPRSGFPVICWNSPGNQQLGQQSYSSKKCAVKSEVSYKTPEQVETNFKGSFCFLSGSKHASAIGSLFSISAIRDLFSISVYSFIDGESFLCDPIFSGLCPCVISHDWLRDS